MNQRSVTLEGLEDIEVQQLYRAMDVLVEASEGPEDEEDGGYTLRRRGHSEDHRLDLVPLQPTKLSDWEYLWPEFEPE